LKFALPYTEPLGWTGGMASTGDSVLPMVMRIGNPPQNNYDTPRLWLVKLPGWERPQLHVVGWSAHADADVGFWPEVARAAMDAVGSSDESFDWYAIIGPALGAQMNRHFRIMTSAAIGPLHLRSDETGYVEFDNTQVARLGVGGGVFDWWPIVATGTACAHDWLTAQRRTVVVQLHRVSALLSLAWDACFTVRAHAQPGDFYAVPPGPARDVHADVLLQRRDVEIPAWCDDAWELLDESALLRNALAMYHEGCLLELPHPFPSTMWFASWPFNIMSERHTAYVSAFSS
jgi:hypothetical protein